MMSKEPRHLKLPALKSSVMRRWVLIAAGTLVLLVGQAANLVTPSELQLFAGIAGVGLINYALGRLTRFGLHMGWLLSISIGLDLTIAGLLVLFFGPGGLVLLFLAALIPYSPLYGAVGLALLASSGAICYLTAALLHEILFEGLAFDATVLDVTHYVETALLTLTGIVFGRAWGTLLNRLQAMRAMLDQVESGSVGERLPANLQDDLGAIGKSINRILDRVDGAAAVMFSEADRIARATEQFTDATHSLAESCTETTRMVTQLAAELQRQDTIGEEHLSKLADMASTAGAMADGAKRVLADGTAMTGAVSEGSEQVMRVSEDLSAFSEDVRGTASTVANLSGSSKRIGDFALSIGKIARQTHVLALNAAIEAARAAEQGHGFAVVAEQVRTLAGEAGRSARDVSNGVADLRDGIARLADAISAGEDQILETSRVAGEARSTLEGLGPGLSATLELVGESASLSEKHAAGISSLQNILSALGAERGRWVNALTEIEGAVKRQAGAADELIEARQQLLQLVQQLRVTATHIWDTTQTDD